MNHKLDKINNKYNISNYLYFRLLFVLILLHLEQECWHIKVKNDLDIGHGIGHSCLEAVSSVLWMQM